MLRFGAFVSFPVLFGLAFVSKEFILITVGEKWIQAVPYLQVLCVAASFSFVGLLYSNLLYSYSKSNIVLYGSAIFYSINLLLSLYLVRLGVFYLVIGCSILTVLGNFLWHFCGKKLLEITTWELIKDIFPYCVLTVFIIFFSNLLVAFVANSIYLLFFIKGILLVSFYLLILWVSKSVILRESVGYLLRR